MTTFVPKVYAVDMTDASQAAVLRQKSPLLYGVVIEANMGQVVRNLTSAMDPTYITNNFKPRVQAAVAQGFKLNIGVGTQYCSPDLCARDAWEDQFGKKWLQEANFMHSSRNRDTWKSYVNYLVTQTWGTWATFNAQVTSIRIVGPGGEMKYPDADRYDLSAANGAFSFGAYSPDARKLMDAEIPSTKHSNANYHPITGPYFRPGDPGFTVTQATTWYDWYLAKLADVANFQMDYFLSQGFTGDFYVITPGLGTFPIEEDHYWFLQNKCVHYDRFPGVGAAWQYLYPKFKDMGGKRVTYCSSYAEPAPGANDLSTDRRQWTSGHVFWDLAQRFSTSKRMVGENPNETCGISDFQRMFALAVVDKSDIFAVRISHLLNPTTGQASMEQLNALINAFCQPATTVDLSFVPLVRAVLEMYKARAQTELDAVIEEEAEHRGDIDIYNYVLSTLPE